MAIIPVKLSFVNAIDLKKGRYKPMKTALKILTVVVLVVIAFYTGRHSAIEQAEIDIEGNTVIIELDNNVYTHTVE